MPSRERIYWTLQLTSCGLKSDDIVMLFGARDVSHCTYVQQLSKDWYGVYKFDGSTRTEIFNGTLRDVVKFLQHEGLV